jgi:ATP-dependent DNA helicase RecQ
MNDPTPMSQSAPASGSAQPDVLLTRARQVLAERFGYADFLPGQAESLKSVLSKRNLLVVMPTGSGKSLLYQLPALLEDSLTLVVSPLISLMKDQVDELERKRIPATFVNSSLSLDEQRERVRAAAAGRVKLLYVAPERLRNDAFRAALKRMKIARMAVDEAHCISQWGHDFRPDYLRLREFRDEMGKPLVTALTATATARVQRDIIDSLGLAPNEVDVHVHGFDRPNLLLSVVKTSSGDEKDSILREFIAAEKGPGIVYAGTRRVTEDVAALLQDVEKRTVVYHAGMEPEERTAAQEAFLSGKARVVVATSAFGMGIDKRDVRFVVHYNYPGSVEQYYQEIGRAGRDGGTSRCVLLHTPADRFLREFFIDLNYPAREQVEDIYETVWSVSDNPVMLTYREIADLCDEDVKEGQVGAAVRLMDSAGVTRAFAGEPKIAVTLNAPASKFLPNVKSPQQRKAIEALSVAADIEAPGRYELTLGQLAAASGLTDDQVRRALSALDREGLIAYEAPFRGRGIQKVSPEMTPFHKVPIDWKRHYALREAEEKKLQAMEEFMAGRECRRGFILKYFGETSAKSCGVCDVCAAPKEAKPSPGTPLEKSTIAMPILLCVKHLRFPVGKARIAQVVTGSRDKAIVDWKLDKNPAYGLVRAPQEEVKAVIDDLVRRRYLEAGGEPGRPVLALSASGRALTEAVRSEDVRASVADAVPAKKEKLSDAEARVAALKCVVSLKKPLGTSKVAAILCGSKAAWIEGIGAQRFEMYGVLSGSQDDARNLIAAMVVEGLLAKGGSREYPVIEIAEKGRAMLSEGGGIAAAPLPASSPPLIRPDAAMDGSKSTETASESFEKLLEVILTSEPDEARKGLDKLKRFSAKVISERASTAFDAAATPRERCRAAWLAGEVCGRHGIPFLVRCAWSEDSALQRVAVAALAKAARTAEAEARSATSRGQSAREALTGLAENGMEEVREAAKESLESLKPEGEEFE